MECPCTGDLTCVFHEFNNSFSKPQVSLSSFICFEFPRKGGITGCGSLTYSVSYVKYIF